MPPTRPLMLFARYDLDGLIGSYVLYYLRGLSSVAEKILFVSAFYLRRPCQSCFGSSRGRGEAWAFMRCDDVSAAV